ncbi:carbohydrate-binding module family 1 protein [Tulasnella calospora MUT 4182]|uniref:Carbohydrate-binding module family 1 protein n=1 Tax=Tulasnella calospora MUT 4182 TaxID=1051891 RepID=A0A0C3QFM7_9AGAM|nr:carbohydrate-binding module family 1 protein [Tulasnella calospora MUT 4182]
MSPTVLQLTAPTKNDLPAVSIPTLVVSAPLSPSPQSPHSLRSFFGPRGRARSILQFLQPEGPAPAKNNQPDAKVVKLEQALKEMDNTYGPSQPPSLATKFVRKHRRNQSSISISSNSSDGESSAPLIGLHPSFKPSFRSNRNASPIVISLDM